MHYEYKGQHYEIDTEDPAVAKQKILAYLQKTQAPEPTAMDRLKDLGKSAVSLADVGLNTATGALDQLAYPLARAYYGFQMSPQQAAERAQAETTSPKDVLGRALDITKSPAYQNELSRRITGAVGSGVQSIAQPIAQTTGMPQQDVENIMGTGMMALAPRVPGAVSATGSALKSGAVGATEFGKGVYGGAFNTIQKPGSTTVKPWETSSARQPVGDYFATPESMAAWKRGEIPASQMEMRPTTELPEKALARTGGMVPYAGQTARALGEDIGASYRDPYKLAAEIAADYGLHSALPTTARLGLKGYDLLQKARAYQELSKQGFTPLTSAEYKAMQQGGMHPNAPAQPPAPPNSQNYLQRMVEASNEVEATVQPTPAQVNLRQQLSAPQPPAAPPNTMGMMTNEPAGMPSIGEKYAGTPNYQYNERQGHVHGTSTTPLTAEEAQTWQVQHSLTGEPHTIVKHAKSGNVEEVHSVPSQDFVSVKRYNPTNPSTFTTFTAQQLPGGNGKKLYIESPVINGKSQELKFHDMTRPAHFPDEIQ